MAFLQKLINIGVIDSNDFKKNRGIVISNYISLLLSISLSFIYFTKYFFVEYMPHGFSGLFYVIGLFTFVIPIFLSKISYTVISRLILCLGSMVYTWWIFIDSMVDMGVVETNLYDGLRIYLLVLGIIPFLVFDNRNNPVSLLCMFMVNVLSFMFFEEILGLAGVSHAQKGVPGIDYHFMQSRTLIAYLVIAGEFFFFQKVLNGSDDFNHKIQNDLELKTKESKARNISLSEQQQKLYQANQHLEDLVEQKTYEIEIQNNKLVNHAYLNSFEIRKPIENLIQLIEHSKKEQDIDYPKLFEEIKSRSNEVENIIKQISKELNEIDYDGI